MKTVYSSFDGKTFDDAAACEAHEKAALAEKLGKTTFKAADVLAQLDDKPTSWDGAYASEQQIFTQLVQKYLSLRPKPEPKPRKKKPAADAPPADPAYAPSPAALAEASAEIDSALD